MFFLKEKRREYINGRFFTGQKINLINNQTSVLFDFCDSGMTKAQPRKDAIVLH